jgi:hypothetical protein
MIITGFNDLFLFYFFALQLDFSLPLSPEYPGQNPRIIL